MYYLQRLGCHGELYTVVYLNTMFAMDFRYRTIFMAATGIAFRYYSYNLRARAHYTVHVRVRIARFAVM